MALDLRLCSVLDVGWFSGLVWCIGERGSLVCVFFQAEDGMRDLVRSGGLGDVYKRQIAASLTLVPLPRISRGAGWRPVTTAAVVLFLSLIHICRCRRAI